MKNVQLQKPATEIEIAEAIRVSDPATAHTIRRLAFQRDAMTMTTTPTALTPLEAMAAKPWRDPGELCVGKLTAWVEHGDLQLMRGGERLQIASAEAAALVRWLTTPMQQEDGK